MNWTCASAVLLLATTAGARAADMPKSQSESVRWAEYYSAVYRVPIELVGAIIDEESGWNPYATSRKGAAGIMQLMPATAVRSVFAIGLWRRRTFAVESRILPGSNRSSMGIFDW